MLAENQPLALELELYWQDLMDILEPENKDVEMMASLNHLTESRTPAAEALPQCLSFGGNAGTVAHQMDLLTGTLLQHDMWKNLQLHHKPQEKVTKIC
ncbi:hypothetical protein ATANTOWER_006389 [Ataeniobius toweri]|uniref:Uncharacterized protein n=1 Tax=Ataeniobius toweri TaxID=208326 RepID=A0ABU7C9J9_9TELE|nr:hypothetical protein [Ataeniobius toweri]